jgi:dihydrofolate synthase/folylpolyglutamate synthase
MIDLGTLPPATDATPHVQLHPTKAQPPPFDAQAFLSRLGMSLDKLGLERMVRCLGLMGNPHHKLNVIHVAGSNGKGSTVAMLSAVLQQAGWRVGLSISPHLVSVHERIQINGQPIDQATFAALAQQLAALLDANAVPTASRPSYFEAVILMALQYFAQESVDVVVLETGLGGRLDATNVVPQPWLTAITSISLEHTEILGPTLAAIATEKAGILKPSVPVVVGPGLPREAHEVITTKAQALDCPVIVAPPKRFVATGYHRATGMLCVQDTQVPVAAMAPLRQRALATDSAPEDDHPCVWHLPLMGHYQAHNLATVLKVLSVLNTIPAPMGPRAGQVLGLSPIQIQKGVLQTRWPARFQVFPELNLILDGSHNAEGFTTLVQTLDAFLQPEIVAANASAPWPSQAHPPAPGLVWIVSLKANRDPIPLANAIAASPNPLGVVCTAVHSDGPTLQASDRPQRFYDPSRLANILRIRLKERLGSDLPVIADPNPLAALQVAQGLQQASPPNVWVVVTGSLYTAGALLPQLSG